MKEPILTEVAGVELWSIKLFTVTKPFVQRYNLSEPMTLGTFATHDIMGEELVDAH